MFWVSCGVNLEINRIILTDLCYLFQSYQSVNMKFLSPTTITISGMTSSGKTYWLHRVLNENLFETPVENIYWCYGVWQSLYDQMSNVNFIKGIPTSFDELANGRHNIIVLDDLQDEVTNSKSVETLFTRGMHHQNFTVIYITQNLFRQGKNARNIALNSHYTVLFKNPRAKTQTKVLATQTGLKHLVEAYEDCMKEKYGYLIIDLSPHSDERYRLRTHIFPEEDVIVYQ